MNRFPKSCRRLIFGWGPVIESTGITKTNQRHLVDGTPACGQPQVAGGGTLGILKTSYD